MRVVNSLIPEAFKLRVLKFYRALPFCMPQVILHPAFKCNYLCSYCPNHRYLKKEVFEAYTPVDVWLKILDTLEPSIITICGGEPLLYKGIDRLLLNFPRKHILSQVVSNISCNLDALVKAKKTGFRVMASFHPEYASLDDFSKNIKYLKDNGLNVVVNYVAAEKNLRDIKKLKEHFRKNLQVVFRVDAYEDPVLDMKNTGDTADKRLNIHGLDYLYDKRSLDSTNEKTCRAGSRFFIITPDANVYRCYSRFKYLNSLEYADVLGSGGREHSLLGNLAEGSFRAEANKRFTCNLCCKSVCDIDFADVRLTR